MVMVKTGPQIRGQFIVDGTIDAADLAADSVATSKFAANGVKGSHLFSNALSQRIMATGPGVGPVESVPTTDGAYSANLPGFNARFAWAKVVSSDRFAYVFSILAGGSGVRLKVFSVNDAAGSTMFVPALSNSITICWMT